LADHGAPPTLRRISTYSMGLDNLLSLMLASSHNDSSSRFLVLSANRRRQSIDIAGTVRVHRSAKPASTGFVGVSVISPSTGMNSRSRSRYSWAPRRSGLRL
jgi:hypothetical protein